MVTRPWPVDRVARVEHQVDEHLLQLAAVGPDLPGVGREPEHQLLVLAQRAAQHLLHLGTTALISSTWGGGTAAG